MGKSCYPGLSGLGGIRIVGVSRGGEMYLVAFVELKVTFNEDEHTSWLQALDHVSDCLSIVCYLNRTDNSGQTVVEVRQKKSKELTREGLADGNTTARTHPSAELPNVDQVKLTVVMRQSPVDVTELKPAIVGYGVLAQNRGGQVHADELDMGELAGHGYSPGNFKQSKPPLVTV